jgi:PhnB protein
MFSDTFTGMPFVVGNNISLAIVIESIDEIKSIFNKLKEGGTVSMDLQETFWSKCYGTLVDKFGIGWQVSLESEQIEA